MAEGTSFTRESASVPEEEQGTSDSGTLDSSEGSEPQVLSLLSHLRAPSASDLVHKHRVSTNPPLGTKQQHQTFLFF